MGEELSPSTTRLSAIPPLPSLSIEEIIEDVCVIDSMKQQTDREIEEKSFSKEEVAEIITSPMTCAYSLVKIEEYYQVLSKTINEEPQIKEIQKQLEMIEQCEQTFKNQLCCPEKTKTEPTQTSQFTDDLL